MGMWEHLKLGELPLASDPRDLWHREIPQNTHRNKKGVCLHGSCKYVASCL
jgi:hypothetical protein